MDLCLSRNEYEIDGIFGELKDISGRRIAVTLEHAFTDGEKGYYPVVPSGSYDCVRGIHQLEHGPEFETFEVMGIPNHTGVLFHVGNYQKDSHGCILLGEEIQMNGKAQMIVNSGKTFEAFMELQTGVNLFKLLILA